MSSFGVGNNVKLPGKTVDSPNRYKFGEATYEDIYEDLKSKDEKMYSANGLLDMMKRDMDVKRMPQRWQDRTLNDGLFDVVVTFEKAVFDIVVANLMEGNGNHPCLVINIDVKDSASEAALAAPHALLLCKMIEDADDWEAEIDDILMEFSNDTKRNVPEYDVCFQ